MKKRECLENGMAEVEKAELKDFAKGEIARMDKANEQRKGKPSKEQRANAEFRAQAWEKIAKLKGEFTAHTVAKQLGISRPKVSALLTALEKEGKLVSELVKDGKNIHKAYTVKA